MIIQIGLELRLTKKAQKIAPLYFQIFKSMDLQINRTSLILILSHDCHLRIRHRSCDGR